MSNISQFEAAAFAFVERVEGQARKASIEIAKQLRHRLALATPVLHGRAAASWNAAVNEPDTSYKLEGYHDPEGCYEDGNVNIDHMRLGDRLVVSNSVPYIDALNDGRSEKAPPGFIETTIAEVQADTEEIMNAAIRDAATGRFK